MNIFVKGFQWASALAFASIVLPLLWCLEPFWRIRIAVLMEDRIGHLAMNPSVFVRRLHLRGRPPRTSYVFITRSPSNRQLLTMWKRKLMVIESLWLRRASLGFMPILERTRFHLPLPYDNTQHEEFSLAPPSLEFTPEEEREGEALLAKMGIRKDDWFVCFHSRDPAYIGKREGFGERTYKPRHRDCSVSNYLPAAEWIAGQGGFAIRMGQIVDAPLPDCGPRVIDYATRFRSDFMDIYLLAKCRFMLANTSGPWTVSAIFNVPVAAANWCPYVYTGLGRNMMVIPKLMRSKKLGRILSFYEIDELGLFNAPPERDEVFGERYYADEGLEFVENEPQDILDLAKDMIDRLEGRLPPAEQAELQQRYRSFYEGPNGGPLAGAVGPRFAFKYRHMISRDLG